MNGVREFMMETPEKGDFIRADDWMETSKELLEEGKKIKIVPHGNSMFPFWASDRDSIIIGKIEKELKRGDIVLYRRENGIHVAHTIYKIDKGKFFMLGDSQTDIEGPLVREQIIGIVETIIRKNKTIHCDNLWYIILHNGWLRLRIIRPFLIQTWLLLGRLRSKGESKSNEHRN